MSLLSKDYGSSAETVIFANGAVTSAFSYALNQAFQGKNPAKQVAATALKDKHLTLGEANEIWRENNDYDLEVTVDAGQLTVEQVGSFGPNGTALNRPGFPGGSLV